MACDVDNECLKVLQKHDHPPEGIIRNLMTFLSPKCVNACRRLVAAAQAARDKKQAAIVALKKKLKHDAAQARGEKKKGTGTGRSKGMKRPAAKMSSNEKWRVEQKTQALEKEIKELGEELLDNLVKEMSKPGSMNSTILDINGREAGHREHNLYVVIYWFQFWR